MNENEIDITKELAKLIEARDAFMTYIDANVPKDSKGIAFDFSNHPTLDAQAVYEHFYKLDYQARKIRGFVIRNFEVKA
ncbi:hypothetical protein FA592_09435 [Sulfurospirillum diekertiae]|jgi:hypothetical protein|uniref:Uncharacterized protein n=1 Tax=Sulfurospirillum diekertiae TaxID=1854492 RepID=A0A290HAM2_9BACT|nr:hypothetical protein [Sulfurospirillum diekertiae]ATB68602.1 hypothetical protein SJPD1_0480 [Sulfurospirillum diekertiae]QIR76440.1 hypothetical protein FA584_09595 [Sulfurospirillum diekertiae]QIR79068.1 hypothetical protein FA592_09435 [Sulfurospirillum diekertiae]